jgi:DNA-binding LytR/AlgR family response regulator
MSLRALVVDDELPALEELQYRLREAEPRTDVQVAATAMEALRLLRQQRFTAIFVDINMPGLSGLELVELVNALPDPPAVVFVTAYEEFAVRAFELRAVDYLLKPVAPDRLRATLDRILGQRNRPQSEGEATAHGQRLEKLPVESEGRILLIDLPEIRYAEAHDDIVYVHTADRAYPTRFSLNDLERRLPMPPFLRIHRAFIVNMQNVVEISPFFNGTYLLTVRDAGRTQLTVSRGRVKDLRTLIGL